jgi:hypothetical protein
MTFEGITKSAGSEPRDLRRDRLTAPLDPDGHFAYLSIIYHVIVQRRNDLVLHATLTHLLTRSVSQYLLSKKVVRLYLVEIALQDFRFC